MADLDRNLQASSTVKLAGGDEQFIADVVNEDSVNKLLVKASTVPDTLSKLLFTRASLNGAGVTTNMNVNGATTPQSFVINALPTKDTIVKELIFRCFDSGIKVDNFLGKNAMLTNGLLVSITSNGQTSIFNPIRSTGGFDADFAVGVGGKLDIIFAAGNDFLAARFAPDQPFKLIGGTSDNITVTVRDNLTDVTEITFQYFADEVP